MTNPNADQVARLEARIRELEAAVEARNRFIATAGHELRNPLASLEIQVFNLSRALRDSDEPGVVETRIDALRKGLHQFRSQLGVLLDVTRILGGRLRLDLKPTDMAEVIHAGISQMHEELLQAGCPLDTDLALDIVGNWDAHALRMVFTNLLSNALKYGAGRPVCVRVFREGSLAVLSVRDQGIGIDAESQTRVFELFERAVPDDSIQGYGLGLWITRQLVEEMGGRILISSETGSGSTFRVEFSLADQPTAVQRSH
jgi:signal transduction histidine kinase